MSIDYRKGGHIATITINRSHVMHAISIQVFRKLHWAMVDFRDDRELWVGIITGAGNRHAG